MLYDIGECGYHMSVCNLDIFLEFSNYTAFRNISHKMVMAKSRQACV